MATAMNPLKPVRFYGSALPRPRYYGDGSKERVDPPPSVNDSLLRWAESANWAMGGLSHKRSRMQGKIEGRLKNIRDETDDDEKSDDGSAGALTPKTRKKKNSPAKGSARTRERPGRVRRGRDGGGASERGAVFGRKPAAATGATAATVQAPAEGQWGEEEGPSPGRVAARKRASPRLLARQKATKAAAVAPVAEDEVSSPLEFSDSPLEFSVSPSVEFPVRRKAPSPSSLEEEEEEDEEDEVEGSEEEKEKTPAVSASVSVEFPVQPRRRLYERALPEGHDDEDDDSEVNLEEFSLVKQPPRRSSRVRNVRRSFKEFAFSDSEDE